MQIVIISLAEQLQRRRHMAEQMVACPFPWRFQDAVRVNAFPPEYDFAARRRWFGFELSWGEIGCLLSHRALWAQCHAANGGCWCILEDDIRLLPGFPAALQQLEAGAGGWDLVRLMGHMPRTGWGEQRLTGGWELMMHPRQPGGTHGYVLTPAAAGRLLDYTRRIYEPVDNAIDTYWRHRLNVFCLSPAVIGLEPQLHSTIGSRGSRRRPRWPGFKRDLRKGYSLLQRLVFNWRRYGRWH